MLPSLQSKRCVEAPPFHAERLHRRGGTRESSAHRMRPRRAASAAQTVYSPRCELVVGRRRLKGCRSHAPSTRPVIDDLGTPRPTLGARSRPSGASETARPPQRPRAARLARRTPLDDQGAIECGDGTAVARADGQNCERRASRRAVAVEETRRRPRCRERARRASEEASLRLCGAEGRRAALVREEPVAARSHHDGVVGDAVASRRRGSRAPARPLGSKRTEPRGRRCMLTAQTAPRLARRRWPHPLS